MKKIYFSTLLLLLVLKGFSNPQNNNDSSSFYLKIALELKAAGRTADAESNFQKALRFDPADENVRIEYGSFLVDQHKFSPAIEQYNKVLAQNTTHPAALQKLIDVYFKLNNWNEVIRYGQKLDQNTSFKNLNYMIAKSYYETENYGQAEKYLVQQIKTTPNDAETIRLLGRV